MYAAADPLWFQPTAQRMCPVRRLCWSRGPEQIAGNAGAFERTLKISHQTIYRYIRRDWRSGGMLWQGAASALQAPEETVTTGLNAEAGCRGKPMIEDRPACVEARQEVGHYEGDTVQGASWEKACVVTVVERVTGLLLVAKSPDKTVRSLTQRF
ncbi:MAG: IS30 family transposase [Thermomonas sp.]|nr:IS30 family transposase [Thermomonas sp.]